MENSGIHIRAMTADDVASAMILSSTEGWNQTLDDWRFIISSPGNICLVAESQKIIVATATVVNYSEKIFWIGMVLVKKDFRGKGISKLLLNHIFQNLDKEPLVRLDATPQGQKIYHSLGFKEEYQIARMICMAAGPFSGEKMIITPRQVTPEYMPGIITLDKFAFGVERSFLMKMLAERYPQKAWICLKENQTTGFVLGRDGNNFHHIGPVIARTAEDAKILIRCAMKGLEGMPVILDVLCDKKTLMEFLISLGFTVQRYFTRMYWQNNPIPGNPDNIFAICGPEFG